MYPTIKRTVTKSSYFLGLSLGQSLFTMGDKLLSFSGVETLTAAASSTSLSLEQLEDSPLDIIILPAIYAVELSAWEVF